MIAPAHDAQARSILRRKEVNTVYDMRSKTPQMAESYRQWIRDQDTTPVLYGLALQEQCDSAKIKPHNAYVCAGCGKLRDGYTQFQCACGEIKGLWMLDLQVECLYLYAQASMQAEIQNAANPDLRD